MGHEESANDNAAISSKINVDCMNIDLHNDVFAFKECGIRIVHLNKIIYFQNWIKSNIF